MRAGIAPLSAALLVAACSSAPKAPTVDDSKRRPVNVSQAIDLQSCRSELSAAKIVLSETLEVRRAAYMQPPPPAAPAASPNHVFIVNFPTASAEFIVPAEQGARLLKLAQASKLIVIRGRTDAPTETPAETRLAQKRAEAAFRYIAAQVKLPPEGIRLSWQGAGDQISGDQQANRRVEIEIYQAKPEVEVISASAVMAVKPHPSNPVPALRVKSEPPASS